MDFNKLTRSERRTRARKAKATKNFSRIGAGMLAVSILTGTAGIANAAMWDESRQIPNIAGVTLSPEAAAKFPIKYAGNAPQWKPTAEQVAILADAGYEIDWEASNRATAERNTGNVFFEMVLVTKPLNTELIKSKHEATKNLVNDNFYRYGAYLEAMNWNITTAENIDAGNLVEGATDPTNGATGAVNVTFGNPLFGTGITPLGNIGKLPEGEVVSWANPTSTTVDGSVAGDLQGGAADEAFNKNTLVLDSMLPTPERQADLSLDGTQRAINENTVSCVAEGTKCVVAIQGKMAGTGNGSVHLADGTVYASMEEAKGKIPSGMSYSVDDRYRIVATTDVLYIEVDTTLHAERPSVIGEQNAVTSKEGATVWLAPISKAAEGGQFHNNGSVDWGRNYFNLKNEIFPSVKRTNQTAAVDLVSSANEYNNFRIGVDTVLSSPDVRVMNTWIHGVDASGERVENGNYEVTEIDPAGAVHFGPGENGVNEAKNFILHAAVAHPDFKEKWEVPADLYTGRVVDFNGHKATIKVLENTVGSVDTYPFLANNTVRFLVSFDTVPQYFSFASTSFPSLNAGVSAHAKSTAIEFAPGYTVKHAPGTHVEEEPTPDISIIPEEEPTPDISIIPEEEPTPDISIIPEEEPTPDISIIPEEEPTTDTSIIREEEPTTDDSTTAGDVPEDEALTLDIPPTEDIAETGQNLKGLLAGAAVFLLGGISMLLRRKTKAEVTE